MPAVAGTVPAADVRPAYPTRLPDREVAAEDDIEVIAEGADGAEAVALATRHRPEVALIDIQMPVLDGIEVTRRIAADPALAGIHAVILSNCGLDQYVYAGLRAGAAGYLVEDPAMAARGLSNDEIAGQMVIKPGHREHPDQPRHDEAEGA